MDWYEETIESPIRPLVKYLRDNGINTTQSSAKDKYIVFASTKGNKCLEDVAQLLKDYGIQDFDINYKINDFCELFKISIYDDLENLGNPIDKK